MDKKLRNEYILLAITAVSVTITGIVFRQSFLRMLPLYFSMIIMLLNSRVNRYGALMGGLNSLLYTYSYVYHELYASAFYALFFSFPLQVVTFILWTKRKDGRTTRLRKMTQKQRSIVFIISLLIWVIGLLLLNKVGGNYSILDNSATILGVIVTFLTVFAYIEYTYISILSGIINIMLNVAVVFESPEMMPYLIMSVYSAVCVLNAFFRARQIYYEQNIEVDNI